LEADATPDLMAWHVPWHEPTWVLQVIMQAVKFWFGSVGGVSGTGVTTVACARRILPSARSVPEPAVTAIAVKSKSVKRWRIEVSFDISTVVLSCVPTCGRQDGPFWPARQALPSELFKALTFVLRLGPAPQHHDPLLIKNRGRLESGIFTGCTSNPRPYAHEPTKKVPLDRRPGCGY
jgi:hypothetical protein